MGETIDFPGPNERLRLAAEKPTSQKSFCKLFACTMNSIKKMPVLRSINGWLNVCSS